MTYNPNIPQAGDDPIISQGQILTNFGLLNTDFAINHIPFTSGATPGFHTEINFPGPLAADPNLIAPESSLYPKSSGGNTELFFQNGATSANVKQLTGLPIVTTTPIAGATIYGITTPWGWIVNCGTVPAGTNTIPFSTNYPVGAIVLTSLITLQSNSGGNNAFISNINFVAQTFTYTASFASYFLIIGK